MYGNNKVILKGKRILIIEDIQKEFWEETDILEHKNYKNSKILRFLKRTFGRFSTTNKEKEISTP